MTREGGEEEDEDEKPMHPSPGRRSAPLPIIGAPPRRKKDALPPRQKAPTPPPPTGTPPTPHGEWAVFDVEIHKDHVTPERPDPTKQDDFEVTPALIDLFIPVKDI